jgi:hypothetical protein
MCSLPLLVAGAAATAVLQGPLKIDGVSFASKPGVLFVPLRQSASLLGLSVEWVGETGAVIVGGRELKQEEFTRLFDGTMVAPVRLFQDFGAVVEFDPATETALVSKDDRLVTVAWPKQRVEVSLNKQMLRAWQGERLVMETPISSGRRGHRTPSGSFRAGPYKARMHYSRLYDNSPMPYSVQVHGHVFIHGYTSVPRYPASHGCIRMPLRGANAAKWFFHWVKVGTPVEVRADFADPLATAKSKGDAS